MKTILKKTSWFRVIATLSLAVFLAVSCEKKEQVPQGSNVSFTPCQQEILKSNSLPDKVDVAFTDKGVQITYYNFAVTCDFTTVDVTHTFVNGVLNITQQGSPNQADCVCYSDVSYTIERISQNEVNVIFINGVQVYCHNENYPMEIPLQHVKTELGGCNIPYDLRDDDSEIAKDTVIITISEDSFHVFVGFSYTCKVEPFNTQVEIIDNVLYMYIKDICYDYDGNEVDCGYERCHCYYTFDFVFKYQEEINQKYKILLFKNIRPDWAEPISVFAEGIINNKNH